MSFNLKKLSLFLAASFVLCCKADEKKATLNTAKESDKLWAKSVNTELVKSRSIEVSDIKEGAEQVVVKVEDLYKEVFGSEISWPNMQRRCGQAVALAGRIGLTYILLGLARRFVINGLGLETKEHQRRLVKLCATILAYEVCGVAVSRVGQWISWDPRCVAFANKILAAIDSGKTLVSEQPSVQILADNALASSGRSTPLVKMTKAMDKETKMRMADLLRKEIERCMQ